MPSFYLHSAFEKDARNSLAVQWLGLHAATAGGMGWIPGPGTKIPRALAWPKKKKERAKDANQSKGSTSFRALRG